MLRRMHLSRKSLPARPTRYIITAILLIIVWRVLIPHSPSRAASPSVTFLPYKFSLESFNIQHKFANETEPAAKLRKERQQKVRAAFQHAWDGYKQHAWLHDEVRPKSGGNKDNYVGWAATLVDSLDSLYILGLHDEFKNAVKTVGKIDFTKPNAERVPIFETTIRYLGGLLGAYDVSGGKYPVLLQKADELGELLFEAFDTPNGIPVPYYFWQKKNQVLEGEMGVLIAQIGSLSLEFTRLAQLTGKKKYFNGISRITKHLDVAQSSTRIPGLWPSQVDTKTPSFRGTSFTLGAWADSMYEYLPKEHILLAGKTDQYLRMYNYALESSRKHHFFRPKTPGNQDILFAGSSDAGETPILKTEVQHLGCFVGGMVGLGSRINNSPTELELAIQLTNSCVWAYSNTASGIMPEIFHVEACPASGSCDWTDANSTELGHQYGFTYIADRTYQLRPEAIESVFIMYRLTGDVAWQEKGWRMFEAIVKHTTTDIANTQIRDVTDEKPAQDDSMESFWLAETLKYFYLLFSEPGLVSLDDFVLNTEAHPFRQRDHLFEV